MASHLLPIADREPRGRVLGWARVVAPARRLDVPVRFGDREYPYPVELTIERLAPLRQGLELAPLVPRLSGTFPDAGSWSVRLRRALVPLDPGDAATIARELVIVARPYREAAPSYAASLR